MGFLQQTITEADPEAAAPDPDGKKPAKMIEASLLDGALDTLGCVIRTMGSESFPLADETNSEEFSAHCLEFARHVENGSAVPSSSIVASADGSREWTQLRRFFIDRRKDEKQFVTERLEDYGEFVEDLLSGLRQIGQRDQDTEQSVRQSFDIISRALNAGALSDIKAALEESIERVGETFTRQKQEYESQINQLNERMSNLRQDLVIVREEMQRDDLTEVFNRGAFDKAISQSINAHFILNQPVTVALIDIDNFKMINDQWGHSAGDDVLRSIGECLERSFIRKSDLVARYGGDEFAVILHDTKFDHSKPLVERFIDSVQDIVVPYAPEGTRVSCSAGYTEISSADTAETLLMRADKALYAAKAAGRNCAIYAPPTEESHPDPIRAASET